MQHIDFFLSKYILGLFFIYNYVNKILKDILTFLNPVQKYIRFLAICQNTDAMFIAV